MHTGIISFADRIAFNIKSNEFKDMILNKIYKLYNIKIIQKHYYILNDSSIEYIKKNNYLCCLRSNGNPYYVFFTKYNDIPIIYFIDKKIHPNYQKPRIILIRGRFNLSLFENTLLDGEMIKTKDNKWEFIFNDIIVYKGTHLNNINLDKRLEIIYNLLENEYIPDDILDVCTYKVKNYYYLNKNTFKNLLDLSNTLNYTSRGIYLWNYNINYKPILHNFNENNIVSVVREVKDVTKFKVLENDKNIVQENITTKNEITKDKETNILDNENILWICKSTEADVYYLYKDNTKSNYIGIANVSKLSTSKLLRLAFKNKNVSTIIKFKCEYNNIFNKWTPICEI